MTAFYSRKRAFDDNNMIPMINVVFLLLIFFMIAGQIKPRPSPEISLPIEDIDTQAELHSPQIEMNASGEIKLSGEMVTLEELELAVNTDAKGSFSLIVDKQLSAARLDPVLEIFRRSGNSEIKFIVRHNSDR